MNEPSTPDDRRLIAPLWHTAALVGFLLAMAAYGVYAERSAGPSPGTTDHRGSALPLYLGLIAAEWGLLRFVVAGGLRLTGTTFRDLVGARWANWRDVARDVGIAFAVWMAWTAVELLAERVLGRESAGGVVSMLPRDPAEVAAWIALSLTAGICEESIFRGYLQKQLQALTGSAAAAITGQALIFGIAHGYQGLRNTVAITVFGVVFGILAQSRRSLRPGMILHTWTDVFGGLFASRG